MWLVRNLGEILLWAVVIALILLLVFGVALPIFL
jgi:hypothetical protein